MLIDFARRFTFFSTLCVFNQNLNLKRYMKEAPIFFRQLKWGVNQLNEAFEKTGFVSNALCYTT